MLPADLQRISMATLSTKSNISTFKGRFAVKLYYCVLLHFPWYNTVFIVPFTPKPVFQFEARKEAAFLLAKLSSL